MGDFHRDVRFQRGSELIAAHLLVDPGGNLVVPDERVAAHAHLVRACECNQRVGRFEAPDLGLGLDGRPFHCVLGCDGVELIGEHRRIDSLVCEC